MTKKILPSMVIAIFTVFTLCSTAYAASSVENSSADRLSDYKRSEALLTTMILHYEKVEDMSLGCKADCEYNKHSDILTFIGSITLSCKIGQQTYQWHNDNKEVQEFMKTYGDLDDLEDPEFVNEDTSFGEIIGFMNNLNKVSEQMDDLKYVLERKISAKSKQATSCDQLFKESKYYKKKYYAARYNKKTDQKKMKKNVDEDIKYQCKQLDELQDCLSSMFVDLMSVNTGTRNLKESTESRHNPYKNIDFKPTKNALLLTSNSAHATRNEVRQLNEEQFRNCASTALQIDKNKVVLKKAKPGYDRHIILKRDIASLDYTIDDVGGMLSESNVNSSSSKLKIEKYNKMVTDRNKALDRRRRLFDEYNKILVVVREYKMADLMLNGYKDPYKQDCTGTFSTEQSIIQKYCIDKETGEGIVYGGSPFCTLWKS
ncbi:hypothetical protein CXF85_19425 [Colwellia sp. 75C3]|uniref:hypothetical protein n=1 Tax=Colwellia sp. 75C3 TaxID=888425 RepID=UPI000C334D22|nr:hypothetical protein [Colwellia sp. 75C3]PKG80942.1 hypothetical protein CXF85_19425 [Colwellia sp. 75C3]